ncbi:MAG: transposase [Candidatus Marsarchaeota archaeon]|nr:transposase [Candidatus Marsarchaeota archaeon]
MKVKKAYKFRIYPNDKCQKEIELQLNLSKNFYNKLLEKAKEAYEKDKTFKPKRSTFNRIKREIIAENKDFLKIYSQTRCEIEDRIIKAYANFFRRVKEKKQGKMVKVGFPRFKSRDRYYSIIYPQNNGSFSLERERKTDMLRVSRIGRMKIELHRQLEGKIKTIAIKREGREYYAIFTAELIINPSKVEDTNPLGIDMGLNNFVALSDGRTIQKPKFFKEKAKRIARWQRIVARRHKGSKRRQEAKEKLQNEWNGITRASDDFMHKLSNRLVNEEYTSFAVENLNIQNMVRNHRLAQSIQNASWNGFINILFYKAESAGIKVIKVDARNTSKTCSNCGNIMEMSLSMRDYVCNRCGLRMDRDINASINILNRGLTSKKSNLESEALKGRAGLAQTYAQGDGGQYIPMGNANAVEELRTYPATTGEAHTL